MDRETRKVKRNIRKAENQIFRLLFKTAFVIAALVLQIAVFWFVFSVGNFKKNDCFGSIVYRYICWYNPNALCKYPYISYCILLKFTLFWKILRV